MKDLCQIWKVKLSFRGAWEFDGLTWLTPTPLFYDRSTPLLPVGGRGRGQITWRRRVRHRRWDSRSWWESGGRPSARRSAAMRLRGGRRTPPDRRRWQSPRRRSWRRVPAPSNSARRRSRRSRAPAAAGPPTTTTNFLCLQHGMARLTATTAKPDSDSIFNGVAIESLNVDSMRLGKGKGKGTYTWYSAGLDWPLCHCAMAQALPFDEHRRPLAPYW